MVKEINLEELLKKEELDMDDYEKIGDAYHYGNGAEIDLNKALDYYLKGGGYYNYLKAAFCYFDEIKTKDAILKGMELLEEMIGMSDRDEPICLELFYRYAALGNFKEAENCLRVTVNEWFELDGNEENLIIVYFYMNLLGIGTEKDDKKAFSIIEMLEKEGTGNELVDYYYAIFKERGIGTNQDIQEAINHYENVEKIGLEQRLFFLSITNSQCSEFEKFIWLLDKLSEDAFSKFEECYNLVNDVKLEDTEAYKKCFGVDLDLPEEDEEELEEPKTK